MKNEDLRNKYDEVFKGGSNNFFTCNVFEESHALVGKVLKETNGILSDKSVLDIGCGEGMLVAMLAEAGAFVSVGVDYSEEAIKNAYEKFGHKNAEYVCKDYKELDESFDIVTMQGVLEHLDDPWTEVKNIMDTKVKDGGFFVTSSPSFINPRGYVWMTLAKLFDVPMSLTDLHFICPFDMQRFCDENNYDLEYESIHQDWGSGDTMIRDFNKRLRNALRDANMDNSKVDDLLEWLYNANKYYVTNESTGAIVIYRMRKK